MNAKAAPSGGRVLGLGDERDDRVGPGVEVGGQLAAGECAHPLANQLGVLMFGCRLETAVDLAARFGP
jgi:hypothetical protein